MVTRATVVWSPDVLEYDFGPSHPMTPWRLDLTMRLAEELGVLDGAKVLSPQAAPDTLITTVHDAGFVAAVRECSAPGAREDLRYGLGSPDVPVFERMHEVGARVVGGSVACARAVWGGESEHAVNITGGLHHAMPALASGFCIYNDAAAAIADLLATGAARVAYVDLDAHHGDGVERIFWDDPRVLTVSLHESGETLFPGTGFPDQLGGAGALGSAVNVALPAGTDDDGWARAVAAVVPDVVREFSPEVIVSQHGCDAHRLDPLTHLAVSVDALRWGAELVHGLAHEVAAGRWVALGGGGYAVVDVVPRAWTHLLAVATHADLDPATPVPDGWAAHVETHHGWRGPESMTDGGVVAVRPWSAGYDPADPVDRAVRATQRAVFPYLGLDPGP